MSLPRPERCQYYLVQRLGLKATLHPDRGFDGYFSLDYMGSSEYEFGTPSSSLKSMRSEPLVAYQFDITAGGVNRWVYFVAPSTDIDRKIADFKVWLEAHDDKNGRRWLTKEQSWFPEHFKGVAQDYQRVDAWWSFDDDIAWTLDESTHTTLLSAFNAKKVP